MEGLDMQIALLQARLTRAVKNGESLDSPQVRQMDARLERMRTIWAIHRQIRLGVETSESHHAGRVH